MGGKDLIIECLRAEIRGLRWAIDKLWADYVRLNNLYRRKKLK